MMATWKVDNTFVPKFLPNNLKWYERDGLEMLYLHNKCSEFLEDRFAFQKQENSKF